MCIRHIPVSNPSGSKCCANRLSYRFVYALYNLAPPHCSQVSISIPKTCLSLCAHFYYLLVNACLALFLRTAILSSGANCLVQATPRALFCTNTPWQIHREWIWTTLGCPKDEKQGCFSSERVRLTLGLSTSDAKRAIKSSGSRFICSPCQCWCRHGGVYWVASAPWGKSLLPTFFWHPIVGFPFKQVTAQPFEFTPVLCIADDTCMKNGADVSSSSQFICM